VPLPSALELLHKAKKKKRKGNRTKEQKSLQKRSATVSKETHFSVKRDLLQCQKRPTTVDYLPYSFSMPGRHQSLHCLAVTSSSRYLVKLVSLSVDNWSVAKLVPSITEFVFVFKLNLIYHVHQAWTRSRGRAPPLRP
jgi:hypothetical protein